MRPCMYLPSGTEHSTDICQERTHQGSVQGPSWGGFLLQALSSMLAGKDEAVPQDMLAEVAARLQQCLAGLCTSESTLPLDRPSSRHYYTILRTMQAAVSQVRRWCHTQKCSYIVTLWLCITSISDEQLPFGRVTAFGMVRTLLQSRTPQSCPGMQMESLQALSLTTLVDCLRRFWVYGLTASQAKADSLAAHAMSPANDTPPASPRSVLLCFLFAG